jgi:hypothetical protein
MDATKVAAFLALQKECHETATRREQEDRDLISSAERDKFNLESAKVEERNDLEVRIIAWRNEAIQDEAAELQSLGLRQAEELEALKQRHSRELAERKARREDRLKEVQILAESARTILNLRFDDTETNIEKTLEKSKNSLRLRRQFEDEDAKDACFQLMQAQSGIVIDVDSPTSTTSAVPTDSMPLHTTTTINNQMPSDTYEEPLASTSTKSRDQPSVARSSTRATLLGETLNQLLGEHAASKNEQEAEKSDSSSKVILPDHQSSTRSRVTFGPDGLHMSTLETKRPQTSNQDAFRPPKMQKLEGKSRNNLDNQPQTPLEETSTITVLPRNAVENQTTFQVGHILSRTGSNNISEWRSSRSQENLHLRLDGHIFRPWTDRGWVRQHQEWTITPGRVWKLKFNKKNAVVNMTRSSTQFAGRDIWVAFFNTQVLVAFLNCYKMCWPHNDTDEEYVDYPLA